MASQKQVTDVFSSLWSETGTYEEDGIDSYVKRHQDWSDGKIGNWITLALQCDNPANDKINILDAGCGLGFTCHISAYFGDSVVILVTIKKEENMTCVRRCSIDRIDPQMVNMRA